MSKSITIRWEGHVARLGKMTNPCTVITGKPEGKGPPGRPKRRSEDNIKLDVRKVGCENINWTEMATIGFVITEIKF